MNTSGEPDELETLMSGSVGGTRKPTVVIRQGGGCLPYDGNQPHPYGESSQHAYSHHSPYQLVCTSLVRPGKVIRSAHK